VLPEALAGLMAVQRAAVRRGIGVPPPLGVLGKRAGERNSSNATTPQVERRVNRRRQTFEQRFALRSQFVRNQSSLTPRNSKRG